MGKDQAITDATLHKVLPNKWLEENYPIQPIEFYAIDYDNRG